MTYSEEISKRNAEGVVRDYLRMSLEGRAGFIDVKPDTDPRTGSTYFRILVVVLTEELFEEIPSYIMGYTVVVEQIGGGIRLA
jgi:hypothetical protein